MVDRFSYSGILIAVINASIFGKDLSEQDGRRWLILWAGLVSIVRLYIYLLLWPDYGQIYGSINRVKSRLRLTRFEFEGTVTLTNRRKSKIEYGKWCLHLEVDRRDRCSANQQIGSRDQNMI